MTRASEGRWQRTGAAIAAALAIGVAVVLAIAGAGVAEPAFGVPAASHDADAPFATKAHGTAPADAPEVQEARALVPAAVRSLRLRFVEQCGVRQLPYVGALRIAADGTEVLATTVVDNLPIAFDAPGDAARLRVEAPGFVGCDVALEADDRAGRTVVLVPDSGLRFRFVRRSDASDATIRTQVVGDGAFTAWEHRAGADGADEAEAPFRRDRALRWSAEWRARGQWCEVRGEEPPLAGGEHRQVVVDFAAVQLQRHRVVGPSPELLPHLVVRWVSKNGLAQTTVAADGTFERPASVTAPVYVDTNGSSFELREERAGDATLWRPPQPLLGVGLLDGAGALVPTIAQYAGESVGFSVRVHVFVREELPQPLGLVVAGAPLQFAIDRADPRELVLVSAADALAPTRLVVEVTGEPPAETARKGLSLGVRSGDSSRPLTRSAAERIVFDLPRGGDYVLAWQCAGVRARDVATVHVVAGREQTAKLQWPALAAWTGEVAGYDELPPERRWHRIGFPDLDVEVGAVFDPMLGRAVHRVDPHGRFEFVRFADEPPREPATLDWGTVPMAARIVACDGVRRHVVVQPADGLRWVEVDVEAPRPWRLMLFRRGANGVPRAVHNLFDRRQVSVPVTASAPLLGVLLGGESNSVLAWCELRGDAPRVTVRAEALRRVELRARTACERRGVYLVGPGGQWDLGHELATTEPLVLEVPASTRGIGLWNDGLAPREIPLGASGVVVID